MKQGISAIPAMTGGCLPGQKNRRPSIKQELVALTYFTLFVFLDLNIRKIQTFGDPLFGHFQSLQDAHRAAVILSKYSIITPKY